MSEPIMFHKSEEKREFPKTAVGIAAAAIVILVLVFVLLSRRHAEPVVASKLQPNAPYAANLVVSGVDMSEADSQLGGKSTYIDGHIVNHGQSTVTGVMAQVAFANSLGLPPQVGQTQMLRIISRDPYVDTAMLSEQPIAPGGEADFRLIFETVPDNWNTQQPEMRLTKISLK